MKGVKCGGRVCRWLVLVHKVCGSRLKFLWSASSSFCALDLFFQRLVLLSVLATAVAAAI
jgi:hypothetical protein